MVGQWLALSESDSQSSLCGVDIFSQCLRGVLWGWWLRKFNYIQDRVIVETKNTMKLHVMQTIEISYSDISINNNV